MDEWNAEDVAQIAILGNEIAMGWYAMTHDTPLPQRQPTSFMGQVFGTDFGTPGPGLMAPPSLGSNSVLVLALLAVAAVYLLRK